MINMLFPLAVGNAIRVFLTPPPGAVEWRVLRKGGDTFTDADDPDALVVYEGDDRNFVDTAFLMNGVAAYYRPYYRVAGAWVDGGASAYATPEATYEDLSTDAFGVLRDRLEAGLAVEMARGNFATDTGHIQVYTAPPAVDNARFPLVSIHLDSEGPAEYGLGENPGDLLGGALGIGMDSEGRFNQVQISVIGWALNADERIDLRNALNRIILANLPVFEAAGMMMITFSTQDVDALSGEYGASVYQALGSFSCQALRRVGSPSPLIMSTATNGR